MGSSWSLSQSPRPLARVAHIVLLTRVSKGGGRVMVVMVGVRGMGSRRFLRMAGQVHCVRERPRNGIVTGLRMRNEVFCHGVNLVTHPVMMRRGDGVGLPIGLPHRLPFVLEPYLYATCGHVEHFRESNTLLCRRKCGSVVGFVEDLELSGIRAFALFLDGRLLGRSWRNWRG